MKNRWLGPSDEPREGLGGLRKPDRKRGTESREQVVAPDPDSVWAETTSIVEIEAEPPKVPRWLKSS
jgi:hypothetical protein